MLTAFSTAVMIRLARTYSNLMVSLTAANDKLRRRSVRLLCEATAVDAAGGALAAAGGDTRGRWWACSPTYPRTAPGTSRGVDSNGGSCPRRPP